MNRSNNLSDIQVGWKKTWLALEKHGSTWSHSQFYTEEVNHELTWLGVKSTPMIDIAPDEIRNEIGYNKPWKDVDKLIQNELKNTK